MKYCLLHSQANKIKNLMLVLAFVIAPIISYNAESKSKESADLTVRILVVDQSNSIIKRSVQFLESKNYETRSANNVESAVETWKTFKPDIVLLSRFLPLTASSEFIDQNGGIEVLMQAPKDKAKVILNTFAVGGYDIMHDLIDWDLQGKFLSMGRERRHLRELKDLISNESGMYIEPLHTKPPQRIHTLAKLEEAKAKGISIEKIDTLSDVTLKLEQAKKVEQARQTNSFFSRCRDLFRGR